MKDDIAAHVWKRICDMHVCVLVTHRGIRLHARPMGVFPRPDDHAIYLLTDVLGDKDDEIAVKPQVALMFQSGETYVAVSGTAKASNDRAKIQELWTPFARAWWSGPEDPAIRLLTVTPEDAQIWESPGKAFAYGAMLVAAVTGTKPKVGETHKVAL